MTAMYACLPVFSGIPHHFHQAMLSLVPERKPADTNQPCSKGLKASRAAPSPSCQRQSGVWGRGPPGSCGEPLQPIREEFSRATAQSIISQKESLWRVPLRAERHQESCTSCSLRLLFTWWWMVTTTARNKMCFSPPTAVSMKDCNLGFNRRCWNKSSQYPALII